MGLEFGFIYFFGPFGLPLQTFAFEGKFLLVLSELMGLAFLVPYQIFSMCLSSPFILISFIYHPFFDYFLIILGLGDTKQSYYDDYR